jgi:hypothetical protein
MLERDEAPRDRAVDVVERSLDAHAGVDDVREQRQVGGDVRELLRVDAAAESEALDAAQQRAGRDPAPFQAAHQGLARGQPPRDHGIAEVDGQLERVRVHPSAPPSSQPAPVAARPATIEPSR